MDWTPEPPQPKDKLTISLEPELLAFVREKADEANQSISAYVAERLMPEYRKHMAPVWAAELAPDPPMTELEEKRVALWLLEADLRSTQYQLERLRTEVEMLERDEPPLPPPEPPPPEEVPSDEELEQDQEHLCALQHLLRQHEKAMALRKERKSRARPASP